MPKTVLLYFIIFFSISLRAQNVNFDWVAHFGEIYWEKGKSITVDATGNVYSTGYFNSSIDFDPGAGVFTLSVSNDTYGFISKLDQNRNFIWAKKIEGLDVHGLSIKIDELGNIFILGTYGNIIDLDPGPAIFNGEVGDNIFVIKLNSSGDFIWGKTLHNSSTTTNVPYNLALDVLGNVYITGTFGPLSDLDPGSGVYILPTISNSIDIFVLKLDVNGNWVWAKSFGSQSAFDEGNSIALDGSGNVYLTGVISGTCDFDPGLGVFNMVTSNWTAFLLKLNSLGEFVWVKNMASISAISAGYSLSSDQFGNIFLGGTANINGTVDVFICKVDTLGNFIWAKSLGSGANDFLSSISVDAAGSVYATGSFYSTVDFDPSVSTYNLTTQGEKDIFIFKLDSLGNFGWAKSVGGPTNDYGTSIVVDNVGSVYTIGAFEGIADFDPSSGITNLTSLGFDDIFLLKLSRCTSNTFYSINASVCNSYMLNNQIYNATGTYTQTIINSTGCDSIITLNLTINRQLTITNASICQGLSYFAAGSNQTVSGIYKDTLQTTLGCDSIVTTNLTVYPKPTPDLGPDRSLCSNGVASITPGLFSSYLWQDNSTQSNFTIRNMGKYWVKVSDVNNCSSTDTLTVLASDTLPQNFLPANQQLCYGSVFNISVPGYKNYLWSTGDVSSAVSINSFGDFYLTVTDNNNCTGKDTIILQRNFNCIPISIPNAFTPNRDGANDIFKPIISQEIFDYSFTIFNRYGQKVFETNNYSTGWDGTFKGVDQPRNSYVYLINLKNINGVLIVNKGTVILIR